MAQPQHATALKISKPTPEQKKAADPKHSVWVSANAGAGKTHVLVDRAIRLMLDGAEPETILCLTFTKAAAAEMQNRLFERLATWTLASDKDLKAALETLGIADSDDTRIAARRLFTRALETPGGLKIQTIHAFAEKLLRLFPVEAGVAPGFRVLEDVEKNEMLATAQHTVLRMAEHEDSDRDLQHSLALIANNANETRFADLIRDFISRFSDVRVLLGGASQLTEMRDVLARGLEIDPAISVRDVEAELNAIDLTQYRIFAKELAVLGKHGQFHLGRALEAVVQASSNRTQIEALAKLAMTGERTQRKPSTFLSKPNIKNHQSAHDWILVEAERLFNLFAKRDLVLRLDATTALYLAGHHIIGHYLARKHELGAFDFSDLIERAAGLLQRSGNAQWVLYKIDRGLKHVLVDEAQDTSPKQWAIITAITQEFFAGRGSEHAHGRTLFVVGDRKQSIYSFQGADAQAYERMKDELTHQVKTFPSVPLQISYRTVPEILDVVDCVFDNSSHVALGFAQAEERGHTANRKEHGVFELWPMLANDSNDEPEPWGAPVDADPQGSHRRKLAHAIALEVKSWLGARTLPSTTQPVRPGDVLILFRKRGALFAQTLAALRREGIPVAGADRLTMNASLTVKDLLALGQVLLLPEDDHALACILKSPFVPHPASEDELFTLAHGRKQEKLLQRLQMADDEKSKSNFQILQEYQRLADLGPHALYSFVLARWRQAQVTRLGPEAADASDAFLEYCLDYEQQQGTSLAGFVAWFEQSDIELRREMEAGGSEVRLMTIHGSKGLEAPIVILADTAETQDRQTSNLLSIASEARDHELEGLLYWTLSERVKAEVIENWRGVHRTRDAQEKKRLLYVAMTRAKDELYIAGADKNGTANDDSLYFYVEQALENALPGFRARLRKLPSPHFEGKLKTRLGDDPPVVLALTADADKVRDVPDWVTRMPAAEQRKTNQTLTGLINAKAIPGSAAALAARRGTAIHVLLEALASVPEDKRANLAERKARSLGLTASDAASVFSILRHPDLQIFLAHEARSEVELYLTPDGETVTGRIDRMLVRDDGIWLLDYKTTRQPPDQLSEKDEAVQQLALYAEALRQAYPERPVNACLFFTETQASHWLTPELIARSREHLRKKRELTTA